MTDSVHCHFHCTVQQCGNAQCNAGSLRVEKLVALLSALQALDALGMHLLGHLLIASLLLLGSALVFDTLDVGLEVVSVVYQRRGEDKIAGNRR